MSGQGTRAEENKTTTNATVPSPPGGPAKLRHIWAHRAGLPKKIGIELPPMLSPVVYVIGLLWALSHFIPVAEAVAVDALGLAAKVGVSTTHFVGLMGVPSWVFASVPSVLWGVLVLVAVLLWGWKRLA